MFRKRLFISLCALAIIVGMLGTTPINAKRTNETIQSSNYTTPARLDNLVVTINGLKVSDVATITLFLETATEDSSPIKQLSVTGKGKEEYLDMSGSLEDGYYRLNISAPDEYFREPKTWLFMVADSQLVNPQGKSATFNLIPPELQTFKPYRESEVKTNIGSTLEPPTPSPAVMIEPMKSLSDPPKQVIEPSAASIFDSALAFILSPFVDSASASTGYHYFCWESTLSSPGIWSRFTVTNPGVRHGTTGETVLDHIYVAKSGYNTLEIGWIEANWLADSQFGFCWDQVNGYSYFNLPGSSLEVALASSGTTWYADYVSGGSWVVFKTVDLGYSQYSMAFNGGEVFTDYATHPSLLATYTDMAKLYLNGWTNWDWQRWATTTYLHTGDAYSLHSITNYYNFYIHSD